MSAREINIAWFKNLTDVLASYMEVLRYEMRQGAGAQTVEALIHAEIYKILIREFPSDCIRSEFGIGHHFAPVEAAQPQAEAGNGTKPKKTSTGRQFRADIAIFNPLVEPKHGAHASVHPIAIFELKRTGDTKALHDDVYRLAVVSAKITTTGYFLMAAPLAQLLNLIKRLDIFSELVSVQAAPAEIMFNKMQPASSLYNEVDHREKAHFYAKLMFATDDVAAALPALFASSSSAEAGDALVGDKGAETVDVDGVDNDDAQDPYAFVIYGIADNRARLTEETNHRMTFTLAAAPERPKPPPITIPPGAAPEAANA